MNRRVREPPVRLPKSTPADGRNQRRYATGIFQLESLQLRFLQYLDTNPRLPRAETDLALLPKSTLI